MGSTDGIGAVNPRRPTIAATGVQVKDAALAEPAQFRMVLVSFLAAGIGLLAGFIAYLLYNLIGLFTNIVFYHRFVFAFNSARNNHLGAWVIVMPVIGGIIVGFMAKYGSPKIKGHGIRVNESSRSIAADQPAVISGLSLVSLAGRGAAGRPATPKRRNSASKRHSGPSPWPGMRLRRSGWYVCDVQYADSRRDPRD